MNPYAIAAALVVGSAVGSMLTMLLYKGRDFTEHVDDAFAILDEGQVRPAKPVWPPKRPAGSKPPRPTA